MHTENTFCHQASIVSEYLANSIHTSSDNLSHSLDERKWLHSVSQKMERSIEVLKVLAKAVTCLSVHIENEEGFISLGPFTFSLYTSR